MTPLYTIFELFNVE